MNADALVRELEPPPGGAEQFARRRDELAAKPPLTRVRGLALAAGVAVALVTAILLLRQPGDTASPPVADAALSVDVYGAPAFDRLLGRASAPAELMVTVNTQAANVTELESTNEKVRIYSIDPARPAPSP